MAKPKKKIDYKTDATPRAVTTDGLPVFCAFDTLLSINDARPNPQNPNTHDTEQVRLLAAIIASAGWRAPVTISRQSGFIVKGHGRRLAALNLGATQIPVEYQDYASYEEELADLTADNRLAELAVVDNRQLVELVERLQDAVPLELTGYAQTDIDAILTAMQGTVAPDTAGVDGLPEAAGPEPVSRQGDIWLLGPHKVLCGSATDKAAVGRLMQGEKAQLVHTDPPYGVSYEAQSGKFEQIEGDDLRGDDLLNGLLLPSFRLMCENTDPDAAFYIWHASSTRRDFEDAMKAAGLVEKQYIIWAKPAPVLGHADYQWAYEPCFYAEKAGQHATFYGDRAQRTVWAATIRDKTANATTVTGGVVLQDGRGSSLFVTDKVPKNKKMRYIRLSDGRGVELYAADRTDDLWHVARERGAEHPTQKPVELATRALENSSQTGDLVIDYFAGSGCTLLAAEQLGRRCYSIDYEPKYVDLIVRRWLKLTDADGAQRIRDGVTTFVPAAELLANELTEEAPPDELLD